MSDLPSPTKHALPARPPTPENPAPQDAEDGATAQSPENLKRAHPASSSSPSEQRRQKRPPGNNGNYPWYHPSYVENPWAQLEMQMGIKPVFVPGSSLDGVKDYFGGGGKPAFRGKKW